MKKKTQEPTLSISGENVIGTINAGGNASVKISQKIIKQSTPELTELFKAVNRKVKSRRQDPKVDKDKLAAQVSRIEKEAAKGGKADQGKLEGWVKKLESMAPDIVDVMLAALGGPAAGFTAVFKKIVERARKSSAAGA